MDTFTDKLVLLFIFAGAVGLSLGMIANYCARRVQHGVNNVRHVLDELRRVE